MDSGRASVSEEAKKSRTHTIDLNSESSLQIEIPDAVSEHDGVKFTICSKTTLPQFKSAEMKVVREHDEFIWLHDNLVENEEYAGLVIPPAPPRPEFDASRDKLRKLTEVEDSLTKEELQKMKAELEAEYLALFKKTVSMHEIFLGRIALHPLLHEDPNLKVFLEHEGDLELRGKRTLEYLKGFAKTVQKNVDDKVLLAGRKDEDDYYESEKQFHISYSGRLKETVQVLDRLTGAQKMVADSIIKLHSAFSSMADNENGELGQIVGIAAEAFEKLRKIEGRVSSDNDLKLTDTLKYYIRDSQAAKDLLYRRMRSLANLENANKNLEKANLKGKDIEQAQEAQKKAKERCDLVSSRARPELAELRKCRVANIRKNLVELAELQLKHARNEVQVATAARESIHSLVK